MASPANEVKSDPDGFIQRGIKKSDPLGSTIFVGLRSLDPFLQYGILASGVGASLLNKIGLKTLPPGLPTNTGIKLIDGLGLSPYRLILLTMATGSSVKQIFWLLYTSKERFKPEMAALVSAFNTAFNSLASLAFTTTLFSASLSNGGRFPQPPLIVGSLLYVAGIATETIAEIQRKNFKDDPRNKGKVCTEGLWKYARHINYTGYSAWRTGLFMAAGGWGFGAAALAYLVAVFTQSSIPELDGYCSKNYGEQWTDYKQKTPYQIIPGIW